MNKKFLKYYMETEPEGTSKKYIFLVDNQDIAMTAGVNSFLKNIVNAYNKRETILAENEMSKMNMTKVVPAVV